MTDIVERLRLVVVCISKFRDYPVDRKLLLDAVDEIERLRAALALRNKEVIGSLKNIHGAGP